MPPPGMRRPDNATYDAVAAWLERELDRAAQRPPESGPARGSASPEPRRVRQRDSRPAGLEVDPAALLPPDTQAHGFDTNADALSMEPALLDRYLTAAAKIARIAVGDPIDGARPSSATRP